MLTFYKNNFVDSIIDLIGRTPMVRLNRLAKESTTEVVANIVLKLESMEPCRYYSSN
jgi:cysteine synthase